MTDRKTDWIQTVSGRQFWPLEPTEQDVCLDDIAHALAHQCRFTGHTRFHYSVAQHAVYVSLVDLPAAGYTGSDTDSELERLHHDDSEAYLTDIATPVKNDESFRGYRVFEGRLQKVIENALGIPEQGYGVVYADKVLLRTEARDLMATVPNKPWASKYTALKMHIQPWSPAKAKRMFLWRHEQLTATKALSLWKRMFFWFLFRPIR